MPPSRVIDMYAPLVPTREVMNHIAENLPEPLIEHLRVHRHMDPAGSPMDDEVRSLIRGEAEVLAEMDAAGVERTMVSGFDEAGTAGAIYMTNEIVAGLAERYPDRFVPFMGVDVLRGMEAARQVETWILERNFKGLSLRPFLVGLPGDDRRFYPFYERCVEVGAPVWVDAGADWSTTRPSDLGHPRHFDRVACDFPELKLLLGNAGWPWVLEAAQLAWKHPNVYLSLACDDPRSLAATGSGWEPLLHLGAGPIQDKVLWGSAAFLSRRPLTELVDETRALPLDDAVRDAWLYQNAALLLGLDA